MPERGDDTRQIYFSKALNEALDEELQRDPDVVLIGEDIGVYGGAFGVTKGLAAKHGAERVLDTPISENGFVGLAVGASLLGMRPVVEIMFMDFIALAMDQILNSAGKLHYMYAGQVNVPLVIRTPGGAKGGYGPSHSQMLTNLFVGVPGIKIVAPATPYQAKGLLKSAVRDANPVLFVENKRLYSQRGHVPGAEYTIPLDKAVVAAPGRDLSVFAYSAMVPLCLGVRRALAAQGIEIEVIDLVTLQPLDREAIAESVRKTGRAVCVEEACVTSGVGAEVAAVIAETCMDSLEAPILRVGAKDVPVPASPELERLVLPGSEDVAGAVKRAMEW